VERLFWHSKTNVKTRSKLKIKLKNVIITGYNFSKRPLSLNSPTMGSESDEIPVEDSDESLLDFKEINDLEFNIPHVSPPSLESVLWDMESEGSDNASLLSFQTMSHKFRSMLCHNILQGISAQISSASDRVDAGQPTVIINSVKYIAVGMSHGYILNFDFDQNLCWCCHDSNTVDQGAVSALAFNLESTRVLVGYERGYISMLDAANGDVIRRLPDAHAPQTAVLYLRFTFLSNLALVGDSSGCVFSMTFNRRLGRRSWDSKCLFSGARGEVCVFEPLIKGQEVEFLNRQVLVAMATLSKVIIISIKPKLKVYFSQQLPRICTALPLISWQLVSVGKSFQPVLAWGRGNELHYTRVITHYHSHRVRIVPLRSVQLSYTMMGLHWLGTRHLAIMDTSENLRLIEVRSQRELEVLEVANAGLVYSSAHFKALAVGGGVSEAFALAGERACYNSISSRGDQLLILGTRAVHLVKLRSWPERLLYLSEQNRWTEALNLAADEGSTRETYAVTLLTKYLESLNRNAVDKESLTAAVRCCVKLEKITILCNDIFEAVSTEPNNLEYYYDLLTDHIVNENLTYLSPSVAQKLVSYLDQKDPQALEKVLLSLDVTCLDLHQVLKICKKSKLYNAWIYITTKTLKDFASPLTEFLNELTPDNHRLGNVMLVYISSCLAGLAYPTGTLSPAETQVARSDVLRCLETSHSPAASDSEAPYPYLRALLHYNTREFLNVVGLAFNEAQEFLGEMGVQRKTRLIGILAGLAKRPEFTESQKINVICFISRLVVQNNLETDRHMLDMLITSLTSAKTSLSLRDHSEREQAWLDLLNAKKLSHLKADELLKISLDSKCYRVSEFLYEVKRDYANIVECYLKDPVRKQEVFNYILNYINVEERFIRQQFMMNFKELCMISSKKSAEVVIQYFPDLVPQFTAMLEQDPDLQYAFLGEIIASDIKVPPDIAETYLRLLCERNRPAVCAYLQVSTCRNEEALRITREYQVHPATAMMLEHGGEWMEALELLLEQDLINEAVSLCVRGAEHLDNEGAQKLWLTLLQNKRTTSGTSLRQLLHAAAPHVPPTQLLDLVSNANFGDIKALLKGMLNDYNHDVVMLTTTLRLLDKDLHHGHSEVEGNEFAARGGKLNLRS
ncbi:unnamed protein product, partial [Callosobruchus maculatus]